MMASTEVRFTNDQLGMIERTTSDCSSLSDGSVKANATLLEEKPSSIAPCSHDEGKPRDLPLLGLEKQIKKTDAPAAKTPKDPSKQKMMADPLHLGFRELFGLPERSVRTDKEKEQEAEASDWTLGTTVTFETATSSDDADEQEQAAESRDGLQKEGCSSSPSHKGSKEEKVSATPNSADIIKAGKAPAEETQPTSLDTLKFEAVHTGLATTAFLCYCLAHISIYELIYGALLELTDSRFQNLNLFNLWLMAAGLMILRSTGGLFEYLSSKRYRRSQREMKQRQSWDNMLSEWLDEKPSIKTALDIIGFYFCYLSLYFFWTKFMTVFFDQREDLYKLLPSTQHYQKVVRDGVSSLVGNPNIAGDSSCSAGKQWDAADYEFLYYQVAKTSYYQYTGNVEAPLYTVTTGVIVYLSAASLSIYFLSKVGFGGFTSIW